MNESHSVDYIGTNIIASGLTGAGVSALVAGLIIMSGPVWTRNYGVELPIFWILIAGFAVSVFVSTGIEIFTEVGALNNRQRSTLLGAKVGLIVGLAVVLIAMFALAASPPAGTTEVCTSVTSSSWTVIHGFNGTTSVTTISTHHITTYNGSYWAGDWSC